jgi:hypothetical protein
MTTSHREEFELDLLRKNAYLFLAFRLSENKQRLGVRESNSARRTRAIGRCLFVDYLREEKKQEAEKDQSRFELLLKPKKVKIKKGLS